MLSIAVMVVHVCKWGVIVTCRSYNIGGNSVRGSRGRNYDIRNTVCCTVLGNSRDYWTDTVVQSRHSRVHGGRAILATAGGGATTAAVLCTHRPARGHFELMNMADDDVLRTVAAGSRRATLRLAHCALVGGIVLSNLVPTTRQRGKYVRENGRTPKNEQIGFAGPSGFPLQVPEFPGRIQIHESTQESHGRGGRAKY